MNELTLRIVVPREHPSFAGHFPEHPIVPGVVLLDLILTEIQTQLKQPLRLIAIPSTKFQRPVGPEETIDVQVRVTAAEEPQTLRARFQATSNGMPVIEGHYVLSMAADAGSG
jgi:3-hydroxymyristoyl/3-hydroxydecanoyl-(acyl carrier protein) dehydratase